MTYTLYAQIHDGKRLRDRTTPHGSEGEALRRLSTLQRCATVVLWRITDGLGQVVREEVCSG